jgi:predicted nucleotidyltransferase
MLDQSVVAGRPARVFVLSKIDMNAPIIHRTLLKRHIGTIEAKYPIKILGLLPRGSAAHVFEEDALDFLAEKRAGLDLLGLCEAEADLSDLLGRPVGIVLISGLKGREAAEFPRMLDPL